MLITGVIDGPLTGGTPKAIEFFVLSNINNLNEYGFGIANNGGGSDGQEFTFSGTANAGDFLYFVNSQNNGFQAFIDFFGFAADFQSNNFSLSLNGDDAVELFHNGTLIDIFGNVNQDGTGTAWEYMDGWAYRNNAQGPNTNFSVGEWNVQNDVLDGATQNGNNGTPAFPIGTYNPGPLPVVLAAFEGSQQGQHIELRWETVREFNNDFFLLERKGEGEAWQPIGRVSARGSSGQVYHFTDQQPLYGSNLYRLRQVDLNGQQHVLPILEVQFRPGKLSPYPNPFRDHIIIPAFAPAGEQVRARLYSAMGQKVQDVWFYNEGHSYRLPVPPDLKRGVYYMQLSTSAGTQQLRLLKH